MITVKTIDIKNDFKKISDLVMAGERVIIARPRNENLVVMSEAGYNEIEKALQNARYLAKIDASVKAIEQGKGIIFTMEELEALETMTADEAKAHIDKIKKNQGK